MGYLSLLFIAVGLRTFIFSFLNLFLPILLVNQFKEMGYQDDKTLLLLVGMFLVFVFTHGLLAIIVGQLISRWGAKIGLILGQLFLLIFLILILLSKRSNSNDFWFFHLGYRDSILVDFLPYLIFGVWKKAVFWKGDRIDGNYQNTFQYCRPISCRTNFNLLKSYRPLFCSLLHYFFLSFVLLLFEKEFEELERFNLKDIILEIKDRKRDFITFGAAGGIEIISFVVWPVFLNLILKDYLKVGSFSSAVHLIAAVFTFIAGKLTDKVGRQKVGRFGAIIVACTWWGKAFFQNPFVLFISDAFYQIFSIFFNLPLTVLAYEHAEGKKKLKYIVFREVCYKIGNLLGLIAFLITVFLNASFWFIFLIGGLFALIPIFTQKNKKNNKIEHKM